ncbi:DnaA-like domain protein (plasmid) [Candidatus Megaera polyxenophila]|nr:DnaA-like domain protein [Candidatus Megaera polyxenophila]
MTIVKKQQEQTDEYLNQKSKAELSLEAQVFLSFKHRTPNRYKLLDKLIRANITPAEELTDKTIYLGEKAKKLLRAILKKLFSNRYVLINHKYITQATRCKSDQNTIILRELERILKIQFYRLYTNDKGTKFSRHYYIELHPAITQELKDTGTLNSEFCPDFYRPTYNNRNIFNEDIRSNVHAHESNFLQNTQELQSDKNNTTQITELPKEPVKPTKLKTRPTNERKKRTNSERKARIYHFRQYKEPQNLKHHYPLTKEDSAKLQSLSGRDFSLNAMNEILLDMSQRRDNTFCSKAQFMAYFGTCLKYEKRDAIKTGNDNFYIKANHTEEKLAVVEKEKQVEQYLAKVEQMAISHVCPKNQLKARLVNVFEPIRAYALLSNIKDLAVIGSIVKIYLRTDCQLSRYETDLVLSQVKSIYSSVEVNIESVEYLVENTCRQVQGYDEVRTKTTPIIPTLQQGVWGDISRQLIEIYGIHIYNNWFSNLTPVINEQNKTIELKAPNSFVKQWIETNYRDTIQETLKKLEFDLKVI